ncbi:HNH endonuclease signature motif containing protein [Actinomycetospora flava]|uniref:HNH endonuclease signature motif containing protein n=1 Tax=Actinomycetospora flava TaxID=3129232 RepID=A0ABU8LXH5_9PSEU
MSSRNPSGTANVCGYDLPMDRSVVAMARNEALAAELLRRGVAMTIEALRAHVYLTLFDGTAAGLTDDALLDLLTAQLRPEPGPDGDEGSGDGPGPDDPGPDDPGPDDDRGPDDAGPDDAGPDDDTGPDHAWPGNEGWPEPDGSEPDGGESDGGEPDGPEPDGRESDDDAGGEDATDEGGHGEATSGEATPGAATTGENGRRGPAVRDGTVEVRLRLTTALGLDDLPASVPRWGTVLASTARALLDRHHEGEWRVVLTDDDGHLQHLLLARGRPDRPPGPHRGARRGRARSSVVELQVPTTLLGALDPDDHPVWTGLLAELRHRLVENGAHPADRQARAPDDDVHPDDARRRRPGAEVDRWVRVRDRCCIVPGCRRPAYAADLDHTVDHAHGGPTLSRNLGVFCRHHHRAKHHGGWRVEQPAPGRFRITTRAGVRYETGPTRIMRPLPAPRPAATARPLPWREQDDGTPWGDTDERTLTRGRSRSLAAESRPVDGDPPGRRRTTAQLDSVRRGRTPVAAIRDPADPPPF